MIKYIHRELTSTWLAIVARQGWHDARFRRAYWRVMRPVYGFFSRSRRALTLALVVGVGGSYGNTQGWPVIDGANLQNNIYQFSSDGIRQELMKLWKEVRDNQRWVTDVVQAYRNVKMAKSAYESLATFDLTQNLSVVDILPEIDLPEGHYFGGPENGFSSGPKQNTYIALRFKTRPGGMASTFNNWAKFKPKLKIDVNQLAGQLANLDFDAIQMVQPKNLSGNPIGAAIARGDASTAVGMRLGMWNQLLQDANSFEKQRQLEEQTEHNLQVRIAEEQMTFEINAQRLQQRLDLEDEALRKRLQGQPSTVALPSTYDVMFAPKVKLARELLAAQQAENKAKLQEMWDGLTALKTTEETRQAAITGDTEVTKLLAEATGIQQNALAAFNQILDKYKVKRKDKGESLGAGVLGVMSLKSDDLEDMKLPAPAQEEIMRLMQATSQGLAMVQIKMQAQKARAESLATVDRVTKDLHDMTAKLATAYQANASSGVARLADNLQQLELAYRQQWDAREERHRAEDAAASQAIWDGFGAANEKYFAYLLEKKPLSAAALVENLSRTYFSFVRTYFGRRSIADVMGPKYDKYADALQKEQDLYNQISD